MYVCLAVDTTRPPSTGVHCDSIGTIVVDCLKKTEK